MTLIDHEVRRLVAPVCERQRASYAMRCAICVRTLSEKLYLCEVRGQGAGASDGQTRNVRSGRVACPLSQVRVRDARTEMRVESGDKRCRRNCVTLGRSDANGGTRTSRACIAVLVRSRTRDA
jgi:hypothetical protein